MYVSCIVTTILSFVKKFGAYITENNNEQCFSSNTTAEIVPQHMHDFLSLLLISFIHDIH